MFGKSYREPEPEENLETTTLNQSSNSPMNDMGSSFTENETRLQSSFSQAETEEINDLDTPEVVNNVEKISRIVSPYFIALIGLALYKENVLIGTVLIGIGLLFLLKVSTQDIGNFFKWVKSFLGFDDNQP
ncbi:MAG: hypothetical protein QNJ60_09605 [Xenococcaceae cyanobacterium MO_188.B19]|nr:hypothetical protein [Xenococcaceae cyanobacterium MO_188.B19]